MSTDRLTLTSKYLGLKTDPPSKGERGKGWEHYAYDVTLSYQGRTLTTPYKLGIGHAEMVPAFRGRGTQGRLVYNHYGPGKDGYAMPPKGPKLPDVISSLLLEARCWFDAASFADFCAELGYDDDSRKAYAVYEACAEIYKKLRTVLGATLYEELAAMDEDAVTAWAKTQSEAANGE